jgi:hypothetical protein
LLLGLSSCSSTESSGGIPLRSFGVYLNPETGLVVAVANDVLAKDNKYPESTVGYFVMAGEIAQSVPDTCRGEIITESTVVERSFGFDIHLEQQATKEVLKQSVFADWRQGLIRFVDCGLLDGDHVSSVSVLPQLKTFFSDRQDKSVWSIIPIFDRWFLGMNPALPVRLPAQLMLAKSGAQSDQSWMKSINTASIPDPLVNEFAVFTEPLPRSSIDRIDDRTEAAQIKVIYAVPSFSQDRGRDTSGEISRAIFAANEWWATQNAGFGLRFDTYRGSLDVGHMEFTTTKQEWYATFFGDQGPTSAVKNGMSRFLNELKRVGWWKSDIEAGSNAMRNGAATAGPLYIVVVEAPAGTYARTGVNSGGCRSIIDALNDQVPIIGIATTGDDLSSCGLLDKTGRFKPTMTVSAQRSWIQAHSGVIDHVAQWMRGLPGCGPSRTPKDGERVKIPGVADSSNAWEIRGGFMRDLAENFDPLSDGFSRGETIATSPTFDPRHDLYFHITSDKLANKAPCNSDISLHPLWDDQPIDKDANRGLRRFSYDRPDETSGPQVKAVYAVKQGATDYQSDTNGEIASALKQMQSFIESSTAGLNTVQIDTYQGKPDVLYFPLPKALTASTDVGCVNSPCPNETTIFEAMQDAGRIEKNKQYVIFYEGGIEFGGKGLCGGSTKGRASFINLDGIRSEMCSNLRFSSTSSDEWSVGLLSLHEIFHALGAVCSAANSHGMHSSASKDIMGALAQGQVVLDPDGIYWFSAPNGCTPLSELSIFKKAP